MDVGIEFSNYRVIEHIGRGGMADVWSARDKRLNRTVAIKTIARDLSHDMDPIKLFEREAKTIAGLEHPHILPIYEFGEYEGQLYIVMRYVSGGSLEDVLEQGPLGLTEMLRLTRAVALALEYAHNSRVIHLDLKPSNILLDSYGLPYLADFGLATMLGPEGRAANPGSGTLLYMAPEQLSADVLDLRADVYSFCVMVFHMVTGQLPFDGTIPLAIRQLQVGELIPDVQHINPALPAALNEVLRHGTTMEPEDRTASIREIITALEAALTGSRAAAPAAASTSSTGIEAQTLPIDQLLSRPIDQLLSRSAAPKADEPAADVPPGEGLVTRQLDQLATGPLDDLLARADKPRANAPERVTEIKIDLSDLGEVAALTPDQMAKREAEDIYHKARRAWARGQGRFILGVTDYILISDYYLNAEANALELDDAGMQMLLRGALEYDHDIAAWWSRLSDDDRRWVSLHALRSENAPARVRALERLETLPDAEPPIIVGRAAQALQVESTRAGQRAALHLLETRGRPPAKPVALVEQLGLRTPSNWREIVFSPDIDLLLAQTALDEGDPQTAEHAARVIGRVRSATAVREIARQQAAGERGALRALALVRDEAPSLPSGVGGGGRLYAWLTNTARRLTENPLHAVWRYIFAVIGAWVGLGIYIWANLSFPGLDLLNPQRFGQTISIGLTFAFFMGFVVLLAGEFPSRLRGFWPWWARLLLSVTFGLLMGTLTWGAYTWFFLNYPPDWGLMAFAGLGAAAAFGLTSVFRLPGWLAVLTTAATLYAPLFFAFERYWQSNAVQPPVIYFNEYNHVFTQLIPVVLIIAIGAHFQALWADLRGLWRLLKSARSADRQTR